jgi:hypothetical protein
VRAQFSGALEATRAQVALVKVRMDAARERSRELGAAPGA